MKVSRPSSATAEALGNTRGYPSLCVTLEYAGPKTKVDLLTQFLRKGKIVSRGADDMSFELPMSEQIAVSLYEETRGVETVMKEVHVLGSSSRGAVTGPHSISLKNTPWWVREPSKTFEWPDDQEAFLWAVFVGEKPEGADEKPLEELLKQAEATWLFKLRMK